VGGTPRSLGGVRGERWTDERTTHRDGSCRNPAAIAFARSSRTMATAQADDRRRHASRSMRALLHSAHDALGAMAMRNARAAVWCACALAAVGVVGAWRARAPAETDPIELYVPTTSRAKKDLETYEREYGESRAQTFVVKAKARGNGLASREAFSEVEEFTRWLFETETEIELMTTEGGNGGMTTGVRQIVRLENFCHKVVDSEPHAPCFMISPLDCFAEGNVSVVGGAMNTAFGATYSARASYKTFDFENAFNMTYVKRSCQQWFNLALPQKVLFGGLHVDENGRLRVDAMRLVVLTRDAKNLHRSGLQNTTFVRVRAPKGDLIGCPEFGPSIDDCSCIEQFNLFSVLEYGCVPEGGSEQPATCCAFMRKLRAHPCIGALWSSDSTLNALGNQILGTCGLPRVIAQSQCVVLPDGSTANASTTTYEPEDLSAIVPMRNIFVCGSMLRSLQTSCPLIAQGNYSGAGACCAAVEDFGKSRCHCGTMHCGGATMTCKDLFAIDGVKQIMQFCALSGYGTPDFDECAAPSVGGAAGREAPPSIGGAKDNPDGEPVDDAYTYVPKHEKREISLKAAEDLLQSWESAWLANIDAKLATFRHVDITYMAERSAEDVIRKASRGTYSLMLIGYAVVASYVVAYFSFSTEVIGARAAIEAVCVIALCTFAALGASAVLRLIFRSITFNAITLQVLPFLSLGLGINDYFVLASHASSAATECESHATEEFILRETMHRGGLSVTLSSAMNFAAFLIGAICPVPIVRNFTIQAACSVATNYAGAVFIFPRILFRDLERWRQRRVIAPASTTLLTRTSSFAKMSLLAAKRPLANMFLSMSPTWRVAARIGVLLMYAAFAAFCCVGVPRVRLGLELSDVVPSDSYVYDFVLDNEAHFATTPVWVVVKDLDFALHAESVRSLEKDFLGVPLVDNVYESTNFMRYYTEHAEAQVGGGKTCSANDTFWYYDDLRMRTSADLCANDALDENQTFICMFRCQAYVPQARVASPLNANSSILDKRCEFRRGVDEGPSTARRSTCFCPHRLLFTPDAFVTNFAAFLNGGERGEISRAFTRPKNGNSSEVSSARMLFYVEDAFTLEDKLEHIRRARAAIAASDVVNKHGGSAFVHDYALYALNEQYLNIRRDLFLALGVSVAVAALVMFAVLDVSTTLTSTAALVFIQLELYGLMFWMDMKLNPVSFINLVTTTGVAVECVSHMARAFTSADPNAGRNARAIFAFKSMAPVITNGVVTTALGIAPVAFSRYSYFVKYFWLQWCAMLGVSLLHGVIIVPIALSFVGSGGRGDENDEESLASST